MREGKYYAGIGSRETPLTMVGTIHQIVSRLNEMGYTLRSGGAPGADTFFHCNADRYEIFLPWAGFNKLPPHNFRQSENHKYFYSPTDEAVQLAEETINGYSRRKQGVRMLLARNMHQVLGEDLQTPVRFVVCWTPGGRVQGGTAHAIRLARSRNILVYNIALPRQLDALKARLGISEQGSLFDD